MTEYLDSGRIEFPAHRITLMKLKGNLNPKEKPFDKLFFQSHLFDISGGTAKFGAVAYGGWKESKGWRIADRAESEPMLGPSSYNKISPEEYQVSFEMPLSFGSIELTRKGKDANNKLFWEKFDKEFIKPESNAELRIKALKHENPHSYYEITLDDGSGLRDSEVTTIANPCPPYPPEDSLSY